ncbi:hypothetical protein QQP08_003690 [Theobroma cacao]|nr:hypothetical protein QQP08_003690 [Theobroma cacao]
MNKLTFSSLKSPACIQPTKFNRPVPFLQSRRGPFDFSTLMELENAMVRDEVWNCKTAGYTR